jgi:hypothetical protein
MHAANGRYLASLAVIDNPGAGLKAIDKVANPPANHGRLSPPASLQNGADILSKTRQRRVEWNIPFTVTRNYRKPSPGKRHFDNPSR